jgi:hypothetical protein
MDCGRFAHHLVIQNSAFYCLSVQCKMGIKVMYIHYWEMGWACGAYGGGERCAQGFGGEA